MSSSAEFGQNQGPWIPLIEYSNKYKISISTLRRRIKHDSIPFRLDNGKYFIIDESPEKLDSQRPKEIANSFQSVEPTHRPIENRDYSMEREEPILSAAHRILDELKKAYTLILQEKDEQIRNLREEISDLRTLVRVLENETARLSGGSFRE
jgi:hypothetical protein